jgi:hypothetical protein
MASSFCGREPLRARSGRIGFRGASFRGRASATAAGMARSRVTGLFSTFLAITRPGSGRGDRRRNNVPHDRVPTGRWGALHARPSADTPPTRAHGGRRGRRDDQAGTKASASPDAGGANDRSSELGRSQSGMGRLDPCCTTDCVEVDRIGEIGGGSGVAGERRDPACDALPARGPGRSIRQKRIRSCLRGPGATGTRAGDEDLIQVASGCQLARSAYASVPVSLEGSQTAGAAANFTSSL